MNLKIFFITSPYLLILDSLLNTYNKKLKFLVFQIPTIFKNLRIPRVSVFSYGNLLFLENNGQD
tara:strand:+ start:1240 stop:1431 length:192 start_codon:yes stop_codon:yes gene_type:complete